MPSGGNPKRLMLVVLVVVVAAIAGGSLAMFGPWGPSAGTDGAPSTNAAPAPAAQPPVDDSNGAGTGDTTGSGEITGRSDAYGSPGPGSVPSDGGSAISVSGSLSGPVTDVGEVSCTTQPGGSYAWRLLGSVDGGPLTLTFNTNSYRGAAAYNTTSITDANGGFMSLEHGEGAEKATVGTNGASRGTFTVTSGERSGSVDAELSDSATGREVHVTGSWHCT